LPSLPAQRRPDDGGEAGTQPAVGGVCSCPPALRARLVKLGKNGWVGTGLSWTKLSSRGSPRHHPE
jgi:hypothetical protein